MTEVAVRGRVLVVDDEPLVGRAVQRVLGSRHDVTVVTSADEALARIAGDAFDVVLCDLMMPGKTGMDLYRELQSRYPALVDRVLFLTGGAFTAEAEEFLARTRVTRVAKPFDAGALRDLVAARVAQAAGRA